MKRFIISFLGSLTALWITIIISFFLVLVTVVGITSASGGSIKKVDSHSILAVSLEGIVVDRPAPTSFMEALSGGFENKSIALNQLTAALENAADDSRIDGVFLDCKGISVGMAQLLAISDALNKFRKSGKWVYAYGDNYTQGDYYLAATGADSVWINPVGMLDIHGLEATTLYFKELLDKLGVDVQVLKVGTYKSAVEPFMLDSMSSANREQQEHFLGSIWKTIAGNIAEARSVGIDTVNVWADSYSYTMPAEWLLDNGIIDAIHYRQEVMTKMGEMTEAEKVSKPVMVSLADYVDACGLTSGVKSKDSDKKKKQIAVLYAVGDITEDATEGIASERLVPEIYDLMDNDKISGLILRVNSGGGSAFASEQIWQALEQFKAKTGKPFYVSMGDYAASGGYYISCGADKIFAEPVTLTGSIGIFGMIPSAEKLLSDKLGINSGTVTTNTTGSITLFKPMTETQRMKMQSYVERGYELFTSRCAEGRHLPVDSIKAIAEGRVWDGRSALEIGLVDSLGSLDDAIAAMAGELGVLDDKNFYVKEYPKVNMSFFDEILNAGNMMSAKAIETNLGPLAPIIRSVKEIRNIDPLQCRMDYILIN